MPDLILVAMIILLGAALSVSLSSRLGLPLEVLLVLQSLALSYIPGLPHIALKPDLVFFFFLPPILFYAAYFTSWRDFKANKRPIGMLAIGLVLITAFAVAVMIRKLVPDMAWPMAFMLGAMVSPPDASAATVLTRKLGVPRRLVTIIEGESLVNDATALVIYRIAIAAALTGTFSWGGAVLKFVEVGAGGVLVGYAVGQAGLAIIRRLTEVRAQTVVSFVAAFGSYQLGEALHVSGVIATVTAGLFFGRCLPLYASPQTRVEAQASWEFVIFVLNAFVFTLIGLQLPNVISQLSGYPRPLLIGYGLLISFTVMAVRMLWVFPSTYIPRWIPAIRRADPAPPWQPVFVLGWSGMRGIVSLAAALALPETLANGGPFPHRSLLIYLTYVVILVTLIVPAFTLPRILKWLGLHAGDENERDELRARIAAIEAALKGLDAQREPGLYPDHHVDDIRGRYARRLETLKANLLPTAFSPITSEDQQFRRLLRDLITWERGALDGLRRNGEIHDEIFHTLARELDLEELRLRTSRL